MSVKRRALILTLALAGIGAAPIGSAHGIDLAGMDRAVAPGEDFAAYANGGWIARTDIPADRSSWGVFSILGDQASQRTAALMQEAAKSGRAADDTRKAADFYASYMDEPAIEARGLAPLKPALDQIAAIADKAALARALGATLRADVDPLNNTEFYTENLFGLWVAQGLHDPQHYAAYLLQGGLGMPDRDYYLSDNPKMAALRTGYRAHIARVLTLAGIGGAQAKAAGVFDLERRIAATHESRADSEEVSKADNSWSRADFDVKAPGMDWSAYDAGARLKPDQGFIVWHPGAVAGEAALVGDTPLAVWKDYLTFHAINRRSGVLPRAFVEERFAFYGQALAGTPRLQARWKRAVGAVNAAMGDAVGRLYVARYFPPQAKAKAQAMVGEIVAAFGRRIDALDWMAPQTKVAARAKLKTLYVGVGYPDRWRSYARLRVVRGDAFGNAERAGRFDYDRSLAKLGRLVDRTEWSMTPQTVNAVNMPLQNALDFPAAILQPPFFDPAAPAVVNYGAIGSVIGHEISHSFDDQGAKFDAQGRLHDWWTPQDLAHFEASSAALVRQYDAYRPFPDLAVNGQLTLSENIADLAGIAAAYDGYRTASRGEPAPQWGGLSGDQQFFLAYGQAHRGKTREPALRQQIVTNGHAPDPYRAATVRNVDAWYKAFDVKPAQALYLAPAQRVRVW